MLTRLCMRRTSRTTDSKLAIKIINRLNKIGPAHDISQRRTFVKEVKSLRLDIRHYRHVKKRAKAKRALKRLRTIAGVLIRELRRELPQHCLFECYQRDFLLYERILRQQQNDKNKIYSLHEPQVYCVAKGKDHKQYEYASKASIASTAKGNLIVGVVSHEQNLHDSNTLPEILRHVEISRGRAAKQAVCDRGYRGKREVNGTSDHFAWKGIKEGYPVPERQEAETVQEACSDRAHYRPPEIGLSNGEELSERRYRRSHQPADGCCRLESEAMAAGHFLALFSMAKTANLSDSLMEI